MKKKISGIYAIVCSGSWRSYIGSSCDLNTRKNTHFCQLRKNKHANKELQQDFNDYGEDKFYFEILELIGEENKLLNREQYWQSIGCALYNSCPLPKTIPKLDDDDVLRFWSKVEKTNNCWNWTGDIRRGYGIFYKNKAFIASRISYKIHNFNFDESLVVCHKCDNRKCVNPEHLFLGSHSQNAKDRGSKGIACKFDANDAKVIREAYLELSIKNMKYLVQWVKDNLGIVATKQSLDSIINNKTHIDNNWRLEKNGKRYVARGEEDIKSKINWNIVTWIRNNYFDCRGYDFIKLELQSQFNITLSRAYIRHICYNIAWHNPSYNHKLKSK